MGRKNVQNTRLSRQITDLHRALLDIVSVLNRPQGDEAIIQEAGIRLDRALFPLLVGIDRFGPIGVVELADRAGRDYTTVSRQVAKLESLDLVESRAGATDRRVRETEITAQGKAMIERIDAVRRRRGRAIFSSWDSQEVDDFVRLAQKFAAALTAHAAQAVSSKPTRAASRRRSAT